MGEPVSVLFGPDAAIQEEDSGILDVDRGFDVVVAGGVGGRRGVGGGEGGGTGATGPEVLEPVA